MNGLIALVGAGEHLPVVDDVDRHPLESVRANGHAPSVVCLPTAARQGEYESVGRWLKMGATHLAARGRACTRYRSSIAPRQTTRATDRGWRPRT